MSARVDLKALEARLPIAHGEEVEALIAALRIAVEALREAKTTICTWHGIAMPESVSMRAWELYQQSPEMVRLNNALARIGEKVAL